MSRFELPIEEHPTQRESLGRKGLADAAVMQNAVWFVTLRWYVVGVFVVVAVLGYLLHDVLGGVGLTVPSVMLLVLAGVLLGANAVLHTLVSRFSPSTLHRSVEGAIWTQIALDLLVITVLVYVVGAVETAVPFTYLFHIVLSCIFFPPRESFLVTCLAAVLYLSLIVLQAVEAIPSPGVLVAEHATRDGFLRVALALFAVAIWYTVWFITSTLSRTVRLRDQQLSILNDQLLEANEEKNRQMLITTHDLKAPFAGIESNIQVLKYRFWDELPESIRSIFERIDARAHMLRDRINAILVLGDLKSRSVETLTIEPIELAQLLSVVIEPLQEKAVTADVTIRCDVSQAAVRSDRNQLQMLFANLISNAISYSKEGGTVYIVSETGPDGPTIRIRDEGIGIRPDALPSIFDEYFKTREATQHNKQSTGLGLAIVKVIAHRLRLRIAVESEPDHGTEFAVTIPNASNGGG